MIHSTMRLRRATANDVSAIQTIGLLTWPATYLPFASPNFVLANLNSWWTEEEVQRSIAEDVTILACEENQVLGMLTLGMFESEPVIWKIYVLPAAQGKGIGRRLLNAAFEQVGDSADIRLEFVKGNERARAFYERAGFELDFEEDPGDGTTTVWMRRKALNAVR